MDGLQCVVAGFTGTNANGLFNGRHEYLAVADFVSFGSCNNGFNSEELSASI